MSRFAGRTVVVTGAGSGIGRRIARRFADEGANVAIADVDPAAADRVRREIEHLGPATSSAVDVRDRAAVRDLIAEVEDRWSAVDVLVNNAAVATDADLLDLSEADWDRDVETALKGAFLCSQAVLPGMVRRGRGVIVMIGSVNGLTYLSNDAYSAAKAGMISLTRGIAVRHGPDGIRTNLVAPGTVRTAAWDHRLAADPDVLTRLARRYPLGRIGDEDDVAAAVAFLASDEAGWINGVVLPVDGGLLAGSLDFSQDLSPRDGNDRS